MPTYEYECDDCGHEFELFQSMKEDPIQLCPACGKDKARRLLGVGAGIIFKGSGFYETDYKRQPETKKTESAKADSNGKAQSNGKSETKPKSESKKESTKTAASAT